MNFKANIVKKKSPTRVAQDNQARSLSAYMAKRIITFHPEQDMWSAIEAMLNMNISGGPVLNDEKEVIGVLSEKDALRLLVDKVYNNHPNEKSMVKEYMTKKVATMDVDKNVFDVARAFLSSNYRRFPVIDKQGKLIGQISRRDLLRASLKLKSALWDREAPSAGTRRQ